MKDLTFVICARIDTPERLANIDHSVAFLQKHFPSKIIIMEEDATSKLDGRYQNVTYVFIKSLFPIFQRTRLMNKAVNEYLTTGYFCLYDMDVFIDPETYREAVEYLKEYSVVYPFNGKFYEIPQKYNRMPDLRTKDILDGDKTLINVNSVGGAIFFRVTDFIKGGMENEFFLGWGHEDGERYIRFSKLGFRVKRLENPMYHFTHPRGINSSGHNPHVRQNEAEYLKVNNMSKADLVRYIDSSFHWCKMRKILKISIVIPTYEMGTRGVDYLKYNIGKILEQTFTDFELVVSDHSINDEIKMLVESYNDDRFVYLRNTTQRGSSTANLNYGIYHTSGVIIKPMFQDDFFFQKNALNLIHDAFVDGAKWVAVGSNSTEDRYTYKHEMIPKYNEDIVYGKNTISSPSVIAYIKDNEILWDERLLWLMDCKFYRDMHNKHGEPFILKDILVTNFGHPLQLGKTISDERKEWEVDLMKNEFPK